MRFNRIFLLLFSLILLFSSCRAAGAEQPKNEEDYIASLTFLGDSTTAHMINRAAVEPARVWATKNRYLNLDSRITSAKIIAPDNGNEETIAAVAARIRPTRLVVTLGIDYGVYYYRDRQDTFAFYYEKLLDAIHEASPDTELILQSVFPVGRNSAAITNDMVNAANETIGKIAARRGLPFVDQSAVLSDEEGFLRDDFCFGNDGIHLNEKAYEVILAHLRECAEQGAQR